MKKYLTLILLLCLFFVTSCSKKEEHDIKDYQVVMEYKDGFKIQVLTDVHLCALSNLEEQEYYLTNSIIKADADLIVVDGDSFFEATKQEVKFFFNFMDSFDKPWVYLKGNHDHQGKFAPSYVDKELNKCKNVINVDFDDNLSGEANFYVDLMNGTDLVYRLFMIDSGSYIRDGVMSYTYGQIEKDQIEHIEKIQQTETDTDYQTLAFFHIPVQEFQTAYNGYVEGLFTGKGENRENSCPCDTNERQFDKLKAAGVRAMFCGHDHVNSSSIIYKDVILAYCVKSSDQIYCDNDMIGYTLITLSNTPFSLDNIENVFIDFNLGVEEGMKYAK